MTIFTIITVIALIVEIIILRYADSKRARKLVVDFFSVMLAVLWTVYLFSQIHFTPKMIFAAIILFFALAAIIKFIYDLLKK